MLHRRSQSARALGARALGARALGALAMSTLALTGCDASPTVTPASEGLPVCDDVWRAGETLPEGYGDGGGCVNDKGVLEVSEVKKCTSADGSFVTYGDKYFAIAGQEISDAGLSSPEYQELYTHCFADGW